MNRFTFTSLKFTLFSLFLLIIAVVLCVLFLGPCSRDVSTTDTTVDIPAVVYLSDSDLSGSDMSGTDLSGSDISPSDKG